MSTAKPHILLVDDETAIIDSLAPFLERSGFAVSVAYDGEEGARLMAAQDPDLIVLDVLMPRKDGREMLREIRRRGDWTPVILLTQVGESTERAMAIEEGADDYLNKPFDPHELVARIRGVLRRARGDGPSLASAHLLISDDVVLDRAARRVRYQTNDVALTPKAVTLLEYLMLHPNELISRERLLDVVWGWDYPAGIRAVDTRISELRKVLHDDRSDPRYIETVPGGGYRFIAPVRSQ
ncbi:MAG: response regulator transcription factor [Chloroflexota bacterium]